MISSIADGIRSLRPPVALDHLSLLADYIDRLIHRLF